MDLEILYSPRCWSKRMGPEEVIDHHWKIATEESEKSRKSIPCQLEIPYGQSPKEKIDIFGTDLPDDSPIYIHIHGGYWQALDRTLSSYMAGPLYKNNIKLMVIGYDLCPDVTLPVIIRQIQRAFAFCMNYAKTKGSRGVSIGGHSAGGHLVATLFKEFVASLPLEDQGLLREVYVISGVFDLVPLVQTTVNLPLKLTEATAKDVSPQFHNFQCENKNLTYKVIVGEYESPEFIRQSFEFNEKLLKLNLKSEYVLVKAKDHFDLVEDLIFEDYELSAMLRKPFK